VLDPRSLVAAELVILATSLPAAGYPAEEVLAQGNRVKEPTV